MCPTCIAAAALVVTGATSAGGLIALIVKRRPARAGMKPVAPASGTEGDHDE